MTNSSIAQFIRICDQQSFLLSAKLTTIGSSKRSKIIIQSEKAPSHCAYILFERGSYYLYPVDSKCAIHCNGRMIKAPMELINSEVVTICDIEFKFESTSPCIKSNHSSFHKLVRAINAFFRNVNDDSRFEMLNSISQTLKCDGARLVIEDAKTGNFSTIARFPQSSNLDRFSERALIWAKNKKQTVLMNATEWQNETDDQGSLELNKIGSILCMPIIENNCIHGYLYLDRFDTAAPFNSDDWEICNALAPIFGDILALYEKTIQQQKLISNLQNSHNSTSGPIIYSCEEMKRILDTTCRFAKTDSTILIIGETGTGKEGIARFIHAHSNRSEKPFVAINCGAIAANLIESELFGHEKGSFTGANSKKTGLFESANGGVVFLDEIGELPPDLQIKLLRVLQESEIMPIGSTNVIKIDIRIIAATNRNLSDEVANNNFRKDLYYRINVLRIELPPLRDRGRDVLLIAQYFINKYSLQFGFPPKQLTLSSQSILIKHSWPGNIRELENVIQKAILISKGTLIEPHDLDIEHPSAHGEDGANTPFETLKIVREKAEHNAIINALQICNGNITMAANLLDIDRKWLTKLIKEYSIDVSMFKL